MDFCIGGTYEAVKLVEYFYHGGVCWFVWVAAYNFDVLCFRFVEVFDNFVVNTNGRVLRHISFNC